jgi:hypothetical protein
MIGNFLRRLSDAERPGSFSNRMRSQRFKHFEGLVSHLTFPISILDIGGTVDFWEKRGWAGREDVSITLINLQKEPSPHSNITSKVGDATCLNEFADKSVDVVFSNSVIEHLFSDGNQCAMAREVARIGRDYWIQTPNFWFPMEPHFQMPGWQWLPRSIRINLLMRKKCGRRGPCANQSDAEALVDEVRLLTKRDLARMFPDAAITPEKFFGLVKSWMVHSTFRR